MHAVASYGQFHDSHHIVHIACMLIIHLVSHRSACCLFLKGGSMASDKSYMISMLYSHVYCITVYHAHACGLSLSGPYCTHLYTALLLCQEPANSSCQLPIFTNCVSVYMCVCVRARTCVPHPLGSSVLAVRQDDHHGHWWLWCPIDLVHRRPF